MIGQIDGHIEVPVSFKRADSGKARRLDTWKSFDAVEQWGIEGLNEGGIVRLLAWIDEKSRMMRKIDLAGHNLVSDEANASVPKGDKRAYHESGCNKKSKSERDLSYDKGVPHLAC